MAAINGAALGGGYEITLACNHRILVDDPRVEVGLPEATLGLLPGGGGVTRVTRMLGIQSALMDVLLQGPRFKPADALEKGLVDELVATREELRPGREGVDPRAPRRPEAAAYNAWDRPGYKMPGGTPQVAQAGGVPPGVPGAAAPADQGRGLPRPAGDPVGRGRGCERRLRHRVADRVALPDQADRRPELQEHDPGVLLRPAGDQRRQAAARRASRRSRPPRSAVLGAGMMGAGIAYSCARAGMQVVLKDVVRRGGRAGQGATARSCSTRRSSAASSPRRRRPSCSPGSRRPRTRPTSPAATWSSRRSSRTRASSTRSSPRSRRT